MTIHNLSRGRTVLFSCDTELESQSIDYERLLVWVAETGKFYFSEGGSSHEVGGAPLITYKILSPIITPQVWTNMPAAASFFFASDTVCKSARQIDLTSYTKARLRVIKLGNAGPAGAKLILRYKAAPWTQTVANYVDIGTSEVSVAINVEHAFLDSGWVDLAAGAKADVFVALIGSGGNGSADPVFGEIIAEFK